MPANLEDAVKTARNWNYTKDEKVRIPVGIFHESKYPTLEEKIGVKVWHEEFKKKSENVKKLWQRFK